ncbi:MAG: hypothetical protein IPO15_09975 [Anaerolineae bacterium]|uniref:hypothetical protein n=1 Tax=Candidatus Amarolinea dominans TaxID=3140696 RepID=UPI0031367066|nr:hypothetical protein [Anaerolineae bacterium]
MSSDGPLLPSEPLDAADERLLATFDEIEKQQLDFSPRRDGGGKRSSGSPRRPCAHHIGVRGARNFATNYTNWLL